MNSIDLILGFYFLGTIGLFAFIVWDLKKTRFVYFDGEKKFRIIKKTPKNNQIEIEGKLHYLDKHKPYFLIGKLGMFPCYFLDQKNIRPIEVGSNKPDLLKPLDLKIVTDMEILKSLLKDPLSKERMIYILLGLIGGFGVGVVAYALLFQNQTITLVNQAVNPATAAMILLGV